MSFEHLRDSWTRLAEQSRNVFSTYEWAETWWRHFGSGELRTRAVGGKVILPLYVGRSGPFRFLRFLGHGPADELGPVCAPEDNELAVSALNEELSAGGFHAFLGENLVAGLPGAKVVDSRPSPVLELGRSWDDLRAGWSANLRQQLGRFERSLLREHDVAYRLADDPERLAQDLDVLFKLHRARWPGSPWFSEAERFHRDFAAVALARGWLRLWLLHLGGRPVAVWLGYRFAGAEVFYQSGRDPALAKDRVGLVLLAHTIREAANDGLREYRFGIGGERYKYRFATSNRDVVTVASARGMLGAAALGLRRARRLLRRGAAESA